MEPPDDAIRCELLLALGDAHARAGETVRSKQIYREAARLAEALRLPELLGRAALGYGGRIAWDVSRDDEHLVPLLEKALDALPDEDSEMRVRLLARLAGGPLRELGSDLERRRSLGAQALTIARRIDKPSTLAHALLGYIGGHHSSDFTPEQVGLAQELIDAALEAGDTERALDGYELHFQSSIELGDMASALRDLHTMTTLAEELAQPAQRWLVAVHRTLLALLEGRFTEAEQLIAETHAVGERAQTWNAAVTYGLQLYVLRREQGRLDEVKALVGKSAVEYPNYPIWRCALANTLAEVGSTLEARAEFESLAADRFRGVPFDEEWDVSLCFLAETAARLDDADRAADLYSLLLPYADRVAISYPEICIGPVSRYLGMLASMTACWEDAESHFHSATNMSARIGARPALAHTQEDYARMLLGRDDKRASELATAAISTYRALGMDIHAARAEALIQKR
jgi:tetratricopeptide (TPR) repeat protein